MSKNEEYQLVFGTNEDVVDASLRTLNGNNIENSDKQDIVTNK